MDCYICGFSNGSDYNTYNNFKIKICSGKKVRISEWNGKALFSVKTILNKRSEKLISLFFKFANFKQTIKSFELVEWYKFNNVFFDGKYLTVNLLNIYIVKIINLVDEVFGNFDNKNNSLTKISDDDNSLTKILDNDNF